MGTTNGLIKTDQSTGTIIRVYGEDSGLPKDTITAIYSGNEEELWIGTDKHGVFRMNTRKERIVRYQHGFGDLENSITAVTGNGEQVWIGTRKGLCAINLPAAQTTWYTISQGGLPHNFVHGLYLDNSGKLWISTHSSTLCYLQDGQIHKIPVNTEVGSLTLGPITEDAGSRIWIGSNGNGIFKIGSDSIVSITTDNGLLSNYCYSIIGDDQKNIWVGHKDGLSRIRTANFSVKFFQHFEDTKESYQFNANAICKDQTGKIWFGTNRGLVIYDPFMESPRYMPPALGIVSLKVNDIERDVADILVLPPGIYKISIGYLGVSLKEPELVTYHYKLVGYDQEFEVTKDNSITYSHLTEGQYKFIIHATSGDGAVTEVPAILNIIIKRPVWKKWWFYLIIFIALSAFVFGYIKRREYMFRLEKAELEGKVQELTLEIQKQKNEIELQRDMIRKKNDNITSSIVYASQIQNAVLPPVELIDRLFPDSFIFNKPKDIVSGDFYWFAEKGDKIIMTLADWHGHGVRVLS
jgi:streptogramin lyase